MTKKIKRPMQRSSFNIKNVGLALDLMLAGQDRVIFPDFLVERRDPFNSEIGHLDPEELRTFDQKFVDKLKNCKAKNLCVIKNLENLYQKYKEQRNQLSEYQQKLHKFIIDNELEASKELGNFDKYISKIVIRNEAEMNIFFDYMALYRLLNDKRAVIQWNLDNPRFFNKSNETVAKSYEKSRFAVLRLDKNLEYNSILTTNIFTKEKRILMDKALNASRKEGCFFICSILDMKDYIMTSGGGIPIDANSNAGKSTLTLLKKHIVNLRKIKTVFNSNISECAREIYGFCLRSGAMEYMTINNIL